MKNVQIWLAGLLAVAVAALFVPSSVGACSTCGDTTPPTPVSLESAYYEGDGNVVFTWSKNQDADFGYYKLAVSKTNQNPSYPNEYAGWASSNRDQISLRLNYSQAKMTAGYTYYVAMSVRDSSGNVSTSNVKTISIPADATSKYSSKSYTKKDPVIAGVSNMAYDKNFRGGVNVAAAEFCTPYIITAPGKGGGPHIRIWNQENNSLQGQFLAFHSADRNGVNVAAGDVDGDGHDELIVVPATNNLAAVKVYDVDLGSDKLGDEVYSLKHQWIALGGAKVGASVAAGDVTGDGKAEIIIGAGPGGGPQVQVFRANGSLIQSFFAFSNEHRGGVFVASGGDFSGNGKEDIVVGEGPGYGSAVRIVESGTWRSYKSFDAFNKGVDSGTYPAVANVDGDADPEVIVGAGWGGGPQVLAYEKDGSRKTVNFFAYDSGFRGGVKVAAKYKPEEKKDDIYTGAGHGGGPNVRKINSY